MSPSPELSMSQIPFLRIGALCAAFLAIATVHGQEKTIKIDGSSTVYPVSAGIAEEFQKQKGDQVKVDVQFSGTTGGFRKFLENQTDIQDASRPINKDEIAQAKANGIDYIELPICFDALTVAVHPKNDWVDSIKVSELKKLWEPEAQGKINKWNQIRPEWPRHRNQTLRGWRRLRNIRLFYRGHRRKDEVEPFGLQRERRRQRIGQGY